MSAKDLTTDQAAKIGKVGRDYDNPMVGAFAAEMVGESYPFTAAMAEIVLKDFTDEQLGRKMAEWLDGKDS